MTYIVSSGTLNPTIPYLLSTVLPTVMNAVLQGEAATAEMPPVSGRTAHRAAPVRPGGAGEPQVPMPTFLVEALAGSCSC